MQNYLAVLMGVFFICTVAWVSEWMERHLKDLLREHGCEKCEHELARCRAEFDQFKIRRTSEDFECLIKQQNK